MASREQEVVTHLRSDTTLDALVPGGIYADGDLGTEGITEATNTPDVWAGGQFRTTIVVRQRRLVPTGDLQDVVTQHTSMSQVVGVWVYGKTDAAIEAALNRVYGLLMGKRFSKAFSATWAGDVDIIQAPELPTGIKFGRGDYRIVSIRFPAAT